MRFFYENVVRHKTFTISKPNDSVINEHVNVPRRSMTGLLFLFRAPFTAGTRDCMNYNLKNIVFQRNNE